MQKSKSLLLLFFRKEGLPSVLYALPLIALAALAKQIWRGFFMPPFGDETGHFLGGRALNNGYILYRDYIDDHGPLCYAITQAYGAFMGWSHPWGARLIGVLFAAIGIVAGTASPLFVTRAQRAVAVALLCATLSSVWLVQGLSLLDYQPLAGMLMLLVLAQCAAPAWLGRPVSPAAAAFAGASAVCVCFLSYGYGPSALLLVLSGLLPLLVTGQRAAVAASCAGAFAVLSAMLLWLFRFADLRGYLVFHFILGQFYFAPYLRMAPWNATFWSPLAALLPNTALPDAIQTAAAAAAIFGILILGFHALRQVGPRAVAPLLLAAGAVIMTNPRGSHQFQDGTFVILALGLLALAVPTLQAPRRLGPAVGGILPAALAVLIAAAVEVTARHAPATPHNLAPAELLRAARWKAWHPDTPAAQPARVTVPGGTVQDLPRVTAAIQRAVRPDETFLALPFALDLYFLFDRLPMRGYVLYLPWDADYARSPWWGVQHDLCADLRRRPPPVIYDNNWIVWNRYDPRIYMACVAGVLHDLYMPAPGAADFYVRKDRVAAWGKL